MRSSTASMVLEAETVLPHTVCGTIPPICIWGPTQSGHPCVSGATTFVPPRKDVLRPRDTERLRTTTKSYYLFRSRFFSALAAFFSLSVFRGFFLTSFFCFCSLLMTGSFKALSSKSIKRTGSPLLSKILISIFPGSKIFKRMIVFYVLA